MKINSALFTIHLVRIPLALFVLAFSGCAAKPAFFKWADKPPMGWNSWDCFGTAVTEDQTLANAKYMAANLKSHGWQYIVVDIQWYEPHASKHAYRSGAELEMDAYGRLLPATNRFPSAQHSQGFKPLAQALHAMGLKFGVHLMRGIPRQAVAQNTPILNTPFHAADIAKISDTCPWNPDMYGIDMTKPGAQEYYDSVLQLLASWQIDFLKVDDLSRPYHQAEIEAIRKAIDRTGRPIVLSTSPGATPLSAGAHIASHANMWRISDDFWDNWGLVKDQFARLDAWTPYRGAGHFPDADMLPFGNIRAFDPHGWTHLTPNEQITVMTLWCIARSPLIVGANLPKNDPFTLNLLTNDEVLAVDQNGFGNHQLFRTADKIAWTAEPRKAPGKYLALFNLADKPATIHIQLKDLNLSTTQVRDLWSHENLGQFSRIFSVQIPSHGAGLYRVTPVSPH